MSFLNAQKATFFAVNEDFDFFRFSNFVRFGPFKNCSMVIFGALDENLA